MSYEQPRALLFDRTIAAGFAHGGAEVGCQDPADGVSHLLSLDSVTQLVFLPSEGSSGSPRVTCSISKLRARSSKLHGQMGYGTITIGLRPVKKKQHAVSGWTDDGTSTLYHVRAQA